MEVPEPPRGRSPEEMSSIPDFGLVDAAYREQAKLVRSLGLLRNLLRGNHAIQTEAIESLQSAEHAAQQVTGFIEQCIHAIPITLRPSPRAAAVAMKTFGLPEIAERILLHLDPLDILRTQQINTTMLSTINHSPNLQRKLLLQPDPDAFFTPIDPILARPFSVRVQFRRENRASEERIPVFVIHLEKPASLRKHKHGSRIQRMLVCQPPIFELEVRMLCECSDAIEGAHQISNTTLGREKLTSESGFTLSEVWDAAKRLRQSHQLCPHARPHLHDSDGYVDCPIRFKARLELQDKDPGLVARQSRLNERTELLALAKQRDMALGPYIAAKLAGMRFHYSIFQMQQLTRRKACNAGQPLPTLAEFESGQPSSN